MKKILLAHLFISVFTISMAQSALHLDGVDDYAIGTLAGPSGNANRTVECWIKTSKSISTQQVIVDWGSMSPLGSRFTLNLIGFGRLRIEVGGNGFNSNRQIADGNWHHVAVTYNNQAALSTCLYIDGMLDTCNNFTQSVNTTSINAIQIGRRNDNVNFFEGSIDELRIWNRARTATEISGDMHAQYCDIPNGLIYYYKFDEGIPNANNMSLSRVVNWAGTNALTLMNMNLQGNISNWSSDTLGAVLDTSLTINGVIIESNDSNANYQWYDCNNQRQIANDTNQVFTPSANGSYAVILSLGSFCRDTSRCVNIISVGLERRASSPEIYFSSSIISMDFEVRTEQMTRFDLYDIRGRLVYSNKSNHIFGEDFGDLEKGVYVLSCKSNSGKSVKAKLIRP